MDDTGAQLFFRIVATAYENQALGIASHWPFEEWGLRFARHRLSAGPRRMLLMCELWRSRHMHWAVT